MENLCPSIEFLVLTKTQHSPWITRLSTASRPPSPSRATLVLGRSSGSRMRCVRSLFTVSQPVHLYPRSLTPSPGQPRHCWRPHRRGRRQDNRPQCLLQAGQDEQAAHRRPVNLLSQSLIHLFLLCSSNGTALSRRGRVRWHQHKAKGQSDLQTTTRTQVRLVAAAPERVCVCVCACKVHEENRRR
ncbi:hypothetical protein VTJ49DRAFT_7078 [Mycothermus thermophilus]|uniref:Uncharacterized protein n=1 Tax=Humicola insolens TaxID=85995 RepID=A0ABR3VI36_HUMIN